MTIKIDYLTLAKVIKVTKPFVSKSELKPVLKALNVVANDDTVTFAATDSFKAVIQTIKAPAIEIIEAGACNIDLMQLDKILKILKFKVPAQVTLETVGDKLTVGILGYSFTTFTINGNYPNLVTVFPKEEDYNNSIFVNPSDLIAALTAMAAGDALKIKFNKNSKRPFEIINAKNVNKNIETKAIVLPVTSWD